MPIHANELRSGNKLQYFIGEGEAEWEVTTIDGQDIVWAETKNENFNQVHKPIPLSPELLEACGFRLESESHFKCSYNTVERIDQIYSESIFDDESNASIKLDCVLDEKTRAVRRIGIRDLTCRGVAGTAGSPHDLKFVHQLQNIIFVLTGTELTINL
jgi:hypothetical protein